MEGVRGLLVAVVEISPPKVLLSILSKSFHNDANYLITARIR